MFRRIENTIQADPSFATDFKELGFLINDTSHIRMINAPDEPFIFNATNNERVNEVRHEAFHSEFNGEHDLCMTNMSQLVCAKK